MISKKQVVIGLLGSVLDSGFHQERWNKWRPTVSLCKHAELPIDRLELIYDPKFKDMASVVMADIPRVSAATEVRGTTQALQDPWDSRRCMPPCMISRAVTISSLTRRTISSTSRRVRTCSRLPVSVDGVATTSRPDCWQTSPTDSKRRGPDGKFAIIDLDLPI